jgi:hypothetical protein
MSVRRNGTHERFLRREIAPNNARCSRRAKTHAAERRRYPAYVKHSEAAPEWYGYCTELTRNCPPSQCPSTASASWTPASGWLITMEK